MSNIVSVRFRVSVYADVDLSTGEVVRVIQDDESVRLDHTAGVPHAVDVVEVAYGISGEPLTSSRITQETAERAIAIAETADWPTWDHA